MKLTRDPIADGGLLDFGRKLREGRITAETATRAYLQRIDALDPAIGAFEYVARDDAIAAARAVDQLVSSGADLGPLMGVPVAIKDNFFVDGMPTGLGTRVEIGYLESPEGSFVQALRRAGCIFLGKTKTVEFALGITGASSPRGMPRNPCDALTIRVPGGSSSGSAAAMAAGLCALAIGTDTGGSVRVPAALCGQAGLKTSTRCWSLDGIVPLSPELDTIGLMAARAEDIALAHVTLKNESLPSPFRLSSLHLGRPISYFYRNLDAEVTARMSSALAKLQHAGVVLTDVEVPEASARETYFPIMLPARLIQLLGRERFLDNQHRIDPIVAARALHGLSVEPLDLDALEAQRLRDAAGMGEKFENIHAWITPTATSLPPPVEALRDPQRNWSLTMGMTQNSQPVNYLDLCAITVPIPDPLSPLPVGLQIVVQHGEEQLALSIAIAIENCLGRPARYDMKAFL